MDDTLPETIITIPTTRANLACFVSDKVSKHNDCPQGTCKTWHRLGHLIKETAVHYFIGYYISVLADLRYLISKPISADTDNVPIISCIPNIFILCIPTGWDRTPSVSPELTYHLSGKTLSVSASLSTLPLIVCDQEVHTNIQVCVCVCVWQGELTPEGR